MGRGYGWSNLLRPLPISNNHTRSTEVRTFNVIPVCQGMRPFGTSFLYAGWDKHFGYQLYQTDPSGNYTGWKATCIGGNHATATSILKTDYEDGVSLESGKRLAFKILAKTVESGSLAADKLELISVQRKRGRHGGAIPASG